MFGEDYQIIYLEEVKQDIANLPKSIALRVKNAIEEKLMTNPIVFGKPLRYSLKGHRRLRVGDYRVVFRIEDDKKTVLVIAIKHRKEIYE